MNIKKLRNDAIIPRRAHPGDAGFDLYTPESFRLLAHGWKQVPLGIAIEIESDEVALVQGRSGLAINHGITTIGNVIDSGYRGQISAVLLNNSDQSIHFQAGDRIAQLVILRLGNLEVREVETLSDTNRGVAGYGSTGLH